MSRTNGEPDWFILVSGGKDSVVAAHMTYPALNQNYQKRPVVIYLDTGKVRLDAQRIYVEQLCDYYGWQLWTLRTNENYTETVQENGHPGPSQHSTIQNKLKGRQRQKLSTISGDGHFITGIRWDESDNRAGTPKAHYDKGTRAWHYKPIAHMSESDLDDYIEKHDIPENPLWGEAHPTDCFCGAHGSPEELIEAEANGFEAFVQRIREVEESVEFHDRKGTWGWGGFSDTRRYQEDAKNDPDQISLCGPSCGAYDRLKADGGEADNAGKSEER